MKVWHVGMKDRFEVLGFCPFWRQNKAVRDRLCMTVSDRADRERRRVFVFEFGTKAYFGGQYLNLDEITRIREAITEPDGSMSHWRVLPVGLDRDQAKRAFSANIKLAWGEAIMSGLIPLGAGAM